MGFDKRKNANEYTPQDGDTLHKIALRETDAGNKLTWQELAKFNWGTDKTDEVNEFLRDELGCYVRDDANNFVISGDLEPEGKLLIPVRFEKSGLATKKTYVLRVKKKEPPPKQFMGCAKVNGVCFEFDKSFVRPAIVDDLKKLQEEVAKHPDARIMIFGHTDKVGSDEYNKKLSERRARSVYAFITDDADTWEELYKEEDWGIRAVQAILKDFGGNYDPGPVDGVKGPKTETAIKNYQGDNGLTVDGIAGPKTRKKLFTEYMTSKHDIKLTPDQFMDPKHMGCGEFNPMEETEAAHEPNRRVTFYLFHRDRLPKLPCREGDLAPCRKQISQPLPRNNDNFHCSFYDSIAIDCVCESQPYLRVVSVEDTFWQGTKPVIPYLSNEIHFRIGAWSIFGEHVPADAIEKMRQDFNKGTFPAPKYQFRQNLPENTYGYYHDGTITLSEPLIKDAIKDPEKRWLLLLVMLEEFGHHMDHLLRNTYSSVGGDAPGDEGTHFAADFIHFNRLVDVDFEYATFHFAQIEDGVTKQTSKKTYLIMKSEIDRETRVRYILMIDSPSDDHGTVKLKNGAKVEVEFFAIRGAGAVHEDITRAAAKEVKVTYDKRLDEGCAWPDVPCKNVDSVETCYYKAWRNIKKKGTLANRSHYGDLQFWHSMCPTGKPTNRQVLEKIIEQAEEWYEKGLKDAKNGLFHIGKLLHLLEDSYSRSHTWRVDKDDKDPTGKKKNQVLTFQDYNAQDPAKHEKADKSPSGAWGHWKTVPGALDAFETAKKILQFHKDKKPFKPEVEKYLRETTYPFAPGVAGKPSGGSRPDYKK